MTTVEPIRSTKNIKKIEKFLSKNPRDLLLFNIGINCGLRISDILALNVKDVKGKHYLQLIEKKTGKFKKLPINKKLKPMLKKFVKGRADEEPLFITKFNNRLSRVTSYFIIKEACKTANLEENFGTHTMRKTFGYHHYKKYHDIAMLQKIFNHSNPAVTLRYIGIEQDFIEKSIINFIL